MKKYREFWINECADDIDGFCGPAFTEIKEKAKDLVHVVEFGAYEELQEAIKILESRVNELFHENIKLKSEL